MMNDYFQANTTKTVTAQSFLEFAKVKNTESIAGGAVVSGE
jgi:hypothetical protein